MKKYNWLLAAMAILAAGCSLEDSFQRLESVDKEITIKAVREGDEAETRTYRQDSDGSVFWVPGDAISLFYGSGADGGSKFTSVNTTDTTRVTNFTGVITAITGGGEIPMDQTFFWGFYPYQEDASCDGTGVTMTLPTKQIAVPGTFATNTFPSIGRSQGLVMGFYNICGGMKFSVTKEGIKRITLKSKGGEYVSGKAKVSFGEDGIPAAEIIDGSDEVILEAPAGEYFIPGKFYFMVMFPTTFSQGFSVKFETFTEEASIEKGKVTVKRSIFGKIPNLDGSATYSKKTGNIPIEDANFKAYLVENFDGNGDGEISYDEAATITNIDLRTDNIMSVQGIEYMQSLQELVCRGNWDNASEQPTGKLTRLDVSNNLALTTISCSYNQLTSLYVSKNTALTSLYCDNNQMTSLDISNNTALTRLNCENNPLTSLDVSNNTALTYLSCWNNQLTSLDVSNNTAMTHLACENNQLTSLDVSSNTALTGLSCNRNQLTSLDVSNNTELTRLLCSHNQLTTLDVSDNTALTHLFCFSNQLTSLDVSMNTALTDLSCWNNQLTSLDVSNNTALTYLFCDRNQLTSLDVSMNTALTDLSCFTNHLTCLDVSNNTALTYLSCYNNQLTSLDVSKNTALTSLYCNNNQLNSLDVSKNTTLTRLDCSPMDFNGVNQLTTLYISQGQEIPNITVDRSVNNIPEETQIVVKPSDGGGEGTGEENWGDEDYPVPEAIDLGLSVKWASFNLGASAPEEYGNYYSWGEVTPKERYDWDTYKWCEGSSTTLTKKNNLDLEDDAANYALHGNWRMPTVSEINDLQTKCTWIPTTLNGVDGYMVWGKKEGYETKRIFLPDSGYKDGTTLHLSDSNGFAGYYWTSSIDSPYSYDKGYTLYFYKYSIQAMFTRSSSRYMGLTIRPVIKEN